jgi:hypothetical protein
MKMKAYHRFRQNRLDSSSLLPGKAESELKPHSQEMLEEGNTGIHLHYSTVKRHLLTDRQHSSEVNITARIGNKENHPSQE